MKEELQSKLVEILTSIQTAAGKASDFAMEQLPDIAQSYVLYGRTVETAGLLVSLLITLCALYVIFRFGLLSKEQDIHFGGGADSRISACVFGGLVFVTSLIPLSTYASSAALVWLAPKAWLLKEIAGLIR